MELGYTLSKNETLNNNYNFYLEIVKYNPHFEDQRGRTIGYKFFMICKDLIRPNEPGLNYKDPFIKDLCEKNNLSYEEIYSSYEKTLSRN